MTNTQIYYNFVKVHYYIKIKTENIKAKLKSCIIINKIKPTTI